MPATNKPWDAKWNYPRRVEFRGDDETGWQWVVKSGRNVLLESGWFTSQFGARYNFMSVRRVMVAASINAGELQCE